MKHKLLIILLFIFSIGSFIFVNYKINSLDYKENVEDKDLYILMNGTKEIIYDLLDEEKLVWGKSNDTKKRYDKWKYIEHNLNEIGGKLKNREEDLLNLKASLFLDDLNNLYNLKLLVGLDLNEFNEGYDKLKKNSDKHSKDLLKLVEG